MPVASIQYPDDIVNRNNNMGWHRNGKRAYRKAVQGILRFLQTAKNAHLYHLCFEPLDEALNQRSSPMTSREMYKANMAMLHALVQMAERDGIQCEWWAAREVADGTKKDHLHVFMVVDATGIKVAKLFNTFEDGRVQQHCKAHGVEFAIFEPKDYQDIHGRNNYMRLPYQGPGNRQTALGTERLADALVWLSYLGKKRSKPEDDKSGQIFPASRPTRKAAQTTPFLPIGSPMGRAEQSLTEKETKHEASATAGDGPESSSQGEASTESPASRPYTSPSQPGMGQAGPRPRVPAYSASSSTEAEAIRPERTHGGTAGPADKADLPITLALGDAMTPAARYIASKYEKAVDLGLDLEAMRRYLLDRGIKRTPAAVVFDLDERYRFHGYAASHPAPPFQTYAEVDAILRRSNQNTTGLNLRESARCKSNVSTSLSSVAGFSR